MPHAEPTHDTWLAGTYGTLLSPCFLVVERRPVTPSAHNTTVNHLPWDGMVPSAFPCRPTQVLMEIRRLVVESEAAHPTARGASGGITFSGGGSSVQAGNGGVDSRLLKRPSR